jgi:hypothetical protein
MYGAGRPAIFGQITFQNIEDLDQSNPARRRWRRAGDF